MMSTEFDDVVLGDSGPCIRFLEEAEDLLRQQFPDEFVACHRGRVVVHDRTLDGILRKLRMAGIEATRVVVQFIHPPCALAVPFGEGG